MIESTAPKYQNIFDTDWASGSTIDWGSTGTAVDWGNTGTTDEFKVHAVGGELKKGVIHKPRGQNFVYFDPPPPSWSLLRNKAYFIK